MTDRYQAFTVVLKDPIREDDAGDLITAIRMLKGVAEVQPVVVGPIDMHIAETRVRLDFHSKVMDFANEILGEGK